MRTASRSRCSSGTSGLKVLACYADGLRPETYRALVRNIPAGYLDLVNVSGDTFHYWREFTSRWLGVSGLATIEQDNVITSEVYPSFDSCDQPWCSFEYIAESAFSDGFSCTSMGCAKFSRELQRDILVSDISPAPVEWMYLDQVLGFTLRSAGYVPHVHGRIDHLHDYGTNNASGKAKAAQLIEIASRKETGDYDSH